MCNGGIGYGEQLVSKKGSNLTIIIYYFVTAATYEKGKERPVVIKLSAIVMIIWTFWNIEEGHPAASVIKNGV